ncbi:MAG: hypothetical protein JJE04_00505 [Acidobacteriia bacterium]|nr:hypothetical protein [Terriglobia bacterium]
MLTRRWLLLLPVALLAKGKKYQHPSGFSFELPGGWTAEMGAVAAALIPPGGKLDPNREDNPEVYTIWPAEAGSDEDLVAATRQSLERSGAKPEGGGVNQPFKAPGRAGTSHTMDFQHPERKVAYRIRIFSLHVKGRRIALLATGHRDKLVAREKDLQEIARSMDYAK